MQGPLDLQQLCRQWAAAGYTLARARSLQLGRLEQAKGGGAALQELIPAVLLPFSLLLSLALPTSSI